jgi:hypothetical protein
LERRKRPSPMISRGEGPVSALKFVSVEELT